MSSILGNPKHKTGAKQKMYCITGHYRLIREDDGGVEFGDVPFVAS